MVGIFAPQYYGSVQYYAAMAQCSHAVVDLGMRYDKRFKSTHRCTIADTQGLLNLTVPVAKPTFAPDQQSERPQQKRTLWTQVRISSHGQWWQDHRVSLESAYGRTPFFEFYIDRFLPFLRDVDMSVTEFDKSIDMTLRKALGVETPVVYSLDEIKNCGDPVVDFRNNNFSSIPIVEYYQVRADKFGFLPGLSALDLLFNMGTESPLVLYHAAQRL